MANTGATILNWLCFVYTAIATVLYYLRYVIVAVLQVPAVLFDFILVIFMTVIVLVEITALRLFPMFSGTMFYDSIRKTKAYINKLYLTKLGTKVSPGSRDYVLKTPRSVKRTQPRRSCKSTSKY
ncbi:uncharacterized protein LOC144362638 [Saccoglossus kowalevskii]